MKRVLLFFFLVFFAGMNDSCRDKDNSLAGRMYRNAFKVSYPLKSMPADDDRIIGEWKASDETPVLVEADKKGSYIITFLATSLYGSDREFAVTSCKIENETFLSVNTGQDNFMIFRVMSFLDNRLTFGVLNNSAASIMEGSSTENFLKRIIAEKNTETLARVFTRYEFTRPPVPGLKKAQQEMLKSTVYNLRTYDLYSKKYPADPELGSLKSKALTGELDSKIHVRDIYELMLSYPEISSKAKEKALARCTTTENCVAFAKYFSSEPEAENMLVKSFALASRLEDYRSIYSDFPDHPEMKKLLPKYAQMELENCERIYDYQSVIDKFPELPAIQRQALVNITLLKESSEKLEFYKDSYCLTPAGMESLKRIAAYLSQVGEIRDLFIVTGQQSVSDDEEEINALRLAANRAFVIRHELLRENADVKIHLFPCGDKASSVPGFGGQVTFFLQGKNVENARRYFSRACTEISSAMILPDPEMEYNNTSLIDNPGIRSDIIKKFGRQIDNHRIGNSYQKVIPPEMFSDIYKGLDPSFKKNREAVLAAAKQKGLSHKGVHLFVMGK